MDNKWRKIILHVDMDAFFASVEQLLNPEWIGQPVIVGADPQDGKGRGVVAAASYEARKYGVHSAMPISRAYQLCPKGVYVQPHGHLYQHYSQQVFTILSGYSPLVEPLSIDEAFLDMTGSLHLYKSLKAIGEKLKNEIKQETHLPASVGIAPSKSVAKIASDLNKPDALVIVEPDKVQDFLDPLPVTKLWGIGEKTFDSLLKMGIRTVYQLRQYPQEVLIQKFGKMGQHILNMATGTDQREVVPTEEVKSVSNEITFDEDQTDMDLVKKTVFNLSEKVAGRLRRSGIQGKTVQLKIRFQDFKTYTRSYSFKSYTNLTDEIYKTSLFLLDEFDPLEIPVRLLGVGVSNLENESGRQLSLWEFDIDKKLKVEKVMDQIQDKFGKNSISHAEGLSHKSKNKN
ncbi:MAG: DNA polymerase IV [Calditrichota bacterium]|jgi:DNA polymerase-4